MRTLAALLSICVIVSGHSVEVASQASDGRRIKDANLALRFVSSNPHDAARERPAQSSAQSKASAEEARWTTRPVRRKRDAELAGGNAVLRDVRAARQRGFDRAVFEFAGAALPGYRIEYARPPFRRGESENVVRISGAAFLSVRFEPAQAHDEAGRGTVNAATDRLRLPVIKEVAGIYDFEGQVGYVLGLAARKGFRVSELRSPTRLVIDVKQ